MVFSAARGKQSRGRLSDARTRLCARPFGPCARLGNGEKGGNRWFSVDPRRHGLCGGRARGTRQGGRRTFDPGWGTTAGATKAETTRFALAISAGGGHLECLMPAVMNLQASVSGAQMTGAGSDSFHGMATVTLLAGNPRLPPGKIGSAPFTATATAGAGRRPTRPEDHGHGLPQARSTTARSRSVAS